MAENSVAKNSVFLMSKCQYFLSTLIRLLGYEKAETASNVKKLIQNFIDGVIEPEEFSTQVQKEMRCSSQSNLTNFLKKSLPHVQRALTSGEISIEGIHPPPVQNLVPTTQDVTSDIEIGKAIANFLKNKVDPKAIKKPFSQPEVAQVLNIRDFKKDSSINKKLNRKLKRLCKDNSSNLKEYKRLHRDVESCLKREREKKIVRQITTVNNYRVELKAVWAGDGCVSYLPADKEPSAIASKDAFDLSSLEECLLNVNDAQKKVTKIVKDYLSYEEKLKQYFRRSEILRILASRASKQNKKETFVSSKQSITRMVKKVYGDEKNVHIFSYRSLLENGKEIDEKRPLKEKGKKGNLTLGREKILLLKSSSTKNDKTRNKLTDKNASDLNSKPANFRNPERLLFNRDQQDDEQHESSSLRKQDIQDSISLSRQLSRLKITNSKRDGISEGISESEIQKAYKDQNKDKQGKATVTMRKKQLAEFLRKEHQIHKAKTSTDRYAEDKDVPKPIIPSLNASLRNADLAPTLLGSWSIFPGDPMTMPITPFANPFFGPQLQEK